MPPKDNDSAILLPLPLGTQVVIRVDYRDNSGEMASLAGTVGVILNAPEAPDGRYQVRLVNGIEAAFPRKHLTIRKLISTREMEAVGEQIMAEVDLFPYVIYRCIVGSHAYGLSHEDSDTDRRGFYLPPAELGWSLFGVPEQLEKPETDECYWELQKFIQLALRANPNVLECLYTPLVETITPLAQELLDQRQIFLTRLVFQTYNGYVISQFKKLEQDLRIRGEIRWKHAMHLIRLLLSGITILRFGFVVLSVDRYREPLLAIRRGEQTWAEVNEWRLRLHREFEEAYQTTSLPLQPDYRVANDFLIHARRSMAKVRGMP
jgi:predicted nucleotidyltransferase